MVDGWAIHESTREYVYPVSRNRLAVRLRTTHQYANECQLLYWNRNLGDRSSASLVRMDRYARDKRFDYYETVITTENATRYIQYMFQVSMNKTVEWINDYGVWSEQPADGFFEYSYTNGQDVFTLPSWAKRAIVYQIFPERFHNGDPGNDIPHSAAWGSTPTPDIFMGGDLRGIIHKIDYLSSLSVNVLYLNPIFCAPSNHKYDTVDYMQVDPMFGTLDDLKELVNSCHRRGIRVLLDGVFNHCGYFFPPFQDVLLNGFRSPYKDWFYLNGFPVDGDMLNYETIGYYKMMPKMRLTNPIVRDFVFKVATYWISEVGIDGWRLDVAEEVDFTFWQQFRVWVKSINPEIFLLAETWRENRDLLRGDQMDSVMNYVFKDAVVDFFAKGTIDSGEFNSRINRFLGVYAQTVHSVLYHPLGTHDTTRFLSLCEGHVSKMMAAIAFQFCFPGMPAIYYGDEVGMLGEGDPGCRGAMQWNEELQNKTLLDWYRSMIRMRLDIPALQEGIFRSHYWHSDNRVYAFIRENRVKDEVDRVYVVINGGEESVTIELPMLESPGTVLTDKLTGFSFEVEAGHIQILMGPYQVNVLSQN